MSPCSQPKIDPMREGHPEPFSLPRTIPGAWDLSDLFTTEELPQAEVNGTAYEKATGTANVRKYETPYAV